MRTWNRFKVTLCISLRNPLQWGMASIPTSPLSSPAPYPSLLFSWTVFLQCMLPRRAETCCQFRIASWSCQCSIGLEVLIYSSVLICLFLQPPPLFSIFLPHFFFSVCLCITQELPVSHTHTYAFCSLTTPPTHTTHTPRMWGQGAAEVAVSNFEIHLFPQTSILCWEWIAFLEEPVSLLGRQATCCLPVMRIPATQG